MIVPPLAPGADALALKLTVAPGAATIAGELAKAGVGGSSTVTVWAVVLVCPKLLVTVSVTV